MTLFVEDFAELLVAEGIAVLGTDLFVDYNENKKDTLVLWTLGGFRTELTMNPNENTEKPILRIEAYYKNNKTAIAKLETILDTIKNKLEYDLGDYHYGYMYNLNGVEYRGRTEDNRVCYYVDINTIRRKNND